MAIRTATTRSRPENVQGLILICFGTLALVFITACGAPRAVRKFDILPNGFIDLQTLPRRENAVFNGPVPIEGDLRRVRYIIQAVDVALLNTAESKVILNELVEYVFDPSAPLLLRKTCLDAINMLHPTIEIRQVVYDVAADDRNPGEIRRIALSILASAVAEDYSSAHVRVMKRALKSDDAGMRGSAISGCAYAKMVECIPDLIDLLERTADGKELSHGRGALRQLIAVQAVQPEQSALRLYLRR